METKKKESEVNRKHTSAVESLKENFQKLIEIASENNTADFTNCIIKANVQLKKITTSTQLASFLCNLRKGRSSKQIGVQPTAISRRRIRNGLTSGKKRIQSGRPSNLELKTTGKRKHNLVESIFRNQPNAKRH